MRSTHEPLYMTCCHVGARIMQRVVVHEVIVDVKLFPFKEVDTIMHIRTRKPVGIAMAQEPCEQAPVPDIVEADHGMLI